ncbi:hypothetical protein VPNG_05675 [Cytospora leucostoma]|uniref:Uncharacterized protein n=1 Tax=Cytospora leucostoma TaxID=1230097 RepID=A0A423X062_9PEZI|nr:hypothetical protein VPNG_05675 [Cytospora leucostoma]
MTNQFYGSSLFQAQFHKRHEDSQPADLEPRDSTVTEVVQTISVVQVIDGSGSTVEVQTVSATPQTNLIDGDTGVLRDRDSHILRGPRISARRGHINSRTPEGSPFNLDSGRNHLCDHHVSGRHVSCTPSLFILFLVLFLFELSFLELRFQLYLYLHTVTTDTWVASSTSFQSSFSSLVTSLSSDASFSDASSSATPSPTSGFTSNFSDTASTGPSSTGWSSFSGSASATYGAGGSDGSGGTGVYATPSSSSPSTSTSASTSTSTSAGSSHNDNTAAPTGTVVGGVVGGVAGLALLVAFAFMLLRVKKGGWGNLRLGKAGAAPAAGAVGAPPGPPPGEGGGGNGAYGTMERAAPYSVASSLAALAGKRASRERAGSGPEMAERGFVRVSGKKLPPVLQFGGDGYTDPRDRSSVTSDASVYRDSMAIFNQPNHQRLALGSPMRPESGVMIMNPGPARTPVTSQTPRPIDSPSLPRSSTFPPTDPRGTTLTEQGYTGEGASSRDGVGRTLAVEDYSRDGAASRASRTSRQSRLSRQSGRFTEHVR